MSDAGDLIPYPGSSTVIRATATTTWTAYPTVAGEKIASFSIESDIDNPGSRRIWVATSSGSSNYTSLAPGDSLSEEPVGFTQIWVRTAASTATFSVWIDFV